MTTITGEEQYSSNPVDLTNWVPPISPGFEWSFTWTVLDDASTDLNEIPIDITGWTAEFDLRESAGGKLIKKLSTTTGEITNGGATGQFVATLPAAATQGLSARQLKTNVVMTDGAGNRVNQFKMTIQVEEIITR